MKTRVAVIAIIIENPESAEGVNTILHAYRQYVIGRMGIPYHAKNCGGRRSGTRDHGPVRQDRAPARCQRQNCLLENLREPSLSRKVLSLFKLC